MSYFDHPYCSNSALTALGQELGILPDFGGNPEEAYRLGTLFDAVVTEPQKIDLLQLRIIDTDYSFTKEEFESAKSMKRSLEADQFYKIFLLNKPDFQKEVYEKDFQFDGFQLSMRGKLDYFIPGMVADLKSTACTSQKSFEAACGQFGYWRQMWLYCSLTKTERAMIFGVSKSKPHRVFIVKIKKGDPKWIEAEKEINQLAFKYYMMK